MAAQRPILTDEVTVDVVELFGDQPDSLFGAGEGTVVDRGQRDPAQPLPEDGGLAVPCIRQSALVGGGLAVAGEVEVAGRRTGHG